MAEVTFAKQFLITLDARSIKLPSDHAGDPRQLPAQSAFTLPRTQIALPRQIQPPNEHEKPFGPNASADKSAAPLDAKFEVVLKPFRVTPSTPASLTLSSQSRLTSVYELKVQVAAQTGYVTNKLKILWEKKPVPDSKTIGEIISTHAQSAQPIELGIMFVGAPSNPPNITAPIAQTEDDTETLLEASANKAPVAQGIYGEAVLETEAFWNDLRAFVVQRTRNEELGNHAVRKFRDSWNNISS